MQEALTIRISETFLKKKKKVYYQSISKQHTEIKLTRIKIRVAYQSIKTKNQETDSFICVDFVKNKVGVLNC